MSREKQKQHPQLYHKLIFQQRATAYILNPTMIHSYANIISSKSGSCACYSHKGVPLSLCCTTYRSKSSGQPCNISRLKQESWVGSMSIRPTPLDVLHQRRKNTRRIHLELHKDRSMQEQYGQIIRLVRPLFAYQRYMFTQSIFCFYAKYHQNKTHILPQLSSDHEFHPCLCWCTYIGPYQCNEHDIFACNNQDVNVEQAKAMDIIILVRITTNFKYGRHEISSQKERVKLRTIDQQHCKI